jgi:hypothetical protein
MTYWRPYRKGTVMIQTFIADGKTLGGLDVIHDARKFHSMGVVIGTNAVESVAPGDVVLYDEGRVEYVRTADGEEFGVIGEAWLHDVLDLDPESIPQGLGAPEAAV